MSQVTLIGDRDQLPVVSPKHVAPNGQEFRPFIEDLNESEGQDDYEESFDPPVIHMLGFTDTMKSICQKYGIAPELITRANRFDAITPEILHKRKFVVIPSASTFKEYIFEVEQEHHELTKNFCYLFTDVCYDQADFYLAKSGYNLAVAIENYHFDIC
ncbi:hypothetical protein HDV03_003906 [Kappamyces sp. JEL0829]|nr:hypothetical protein HDV03_003906 [Kappamyces sp. JEL0829]